MKTIREELFIMLDPYTTSCSNTRSLIETILKLIETRINEMIEVAYKNDPVSVWSLTQVKEMLLKK